MKKTPNATRVEIHIVIKPQDIDVLCVQPNEIAQNAVEPIFLASLRRLKLFVLFEWHLSSF